MFLLADAAAAQAYPGGTTPQRTPSDPGDVGDSGEVRGAQVKGVTLVRGENLAVTGGDLLGLSAIGIVLVAGGVVLVRRTRHTATA